MIDQTELERFVDTIFESTPDDEEVAFWSSSKVNPGYPMTSKRFFKKLRRSGDIGACYFGTSTMRLTTDGDLRNRQSQFAAFYVVVLDDVGSGLGSKIAPDKVPKALRDRVTYVVETSPKNYQWGFVLEEPIEDLELAKAFQKRVVHKSGADAGGCMPNKLVRLPVGVNLKDKYKNGDNLFQCRLISLDAGALWTPDEMLVAVDAGITWDALQKSHNEGSLAPRRSGTTAYLPSTPYHADLDGLVDPILEWLNETDQIVNENGEWITILCPNRAGHTEKDADTAGYSPIGRGDRPDTRGFKCFHDNCKEFRTREFLQYIVQAGGPRTAQDATIEAYLARYGFVMSANSFVDMKSEDFETIKQIGFKNQLSGDVWLPKKNKDGATEFVPVNEYSAFMKESMRLRFTGYTHKVGAGRVVTNPSGAYDHINTWALPEWGDGAFDESYAERFQEFIHYLIPDMEDAEWFLDHLAAKAQDPFYRGPGVIMSTPVEGTGRGTLETMLDRLWGTNNVTSVTLSELITGAASADNNSWITKDWIVIPEAKETDMSRKREVTAYESLKRFVETGPAKMSIKEKWAVQLDAKCYGSVIICSQHGDVLPLDAGSTRFKRIENTVQKISDADFVALYAWMDSGFESHVWRWLRARDLSSMDKFARQKEITLDEEVRTALSQGRAVDAAIGLCIAYAEECQQGGMFVTQYLEYLGVMSNDLELDTVNGWMKPLRRELINKTRGPCNQNGDRWRVTVGTKNTKPRLTTGPSGKLSWAQVTNGKNVLGSVDPVIMRESFIDFCRSRLDELE